VHIVGARTLRFPFLLTALTVALAAWLPRPLRAQALADLPDLAPAVEASQSALSITPPLPAPATPPAAPSPAEPPPPIAVQVGTRSAVRFQNPSALDKLNDASLEGEADVLFWGQVHPYLQWQAGFAGNLGPLTSAASAALLDLVAKLEFAEALHLWVGRMPMASDRASLSTVWALSTWTMPGAYDPFAPTGMGSRPTPGPRRGNNNRGDGATLWGQVGSGTFKYYLGVFGLEQPRTSPLYTARLVLSLLNPEPGFRATSSHFGAKDVLALGVGAQHRAGDSRPPAGDTWPANDFNEFNADLLLEVGSSSSGVLDLESSIAKLWGDNELAKYQFVAQVSYLMPIDIGFGRLQPLLRFQRAALGEASDAGDFTSIDAQLGYIIDGFRVRLIGDYQYSRVRGQTQNAILLGVQMVSHAK